MIVKEAVALLATIDPADVDWHAARYDSASKYSVLMADARRAVARGERIEPQEVRRRIRDIAATCKDDGADFGFIPCLAGESRRVWFVIRAYALGF